MKRHHILSILTCALVLMFAFSNVALAGGSSCSPLCKGKCPSTEKAKASDTKAISAKDATKAGQACSAACKETCAQKCTKECAEDCKGCACKVTADGKMDCSKCTCKACKDCRAKVGAKSAGTVKASSCAAKGCTSSCTKATKASASGK